MTSGYFYVFNLILSFSTDSQSFKKICTWEVLGANVLKVVPDSFLTARELISKISRWRELSNSTPKSLAKSRSKISTNTASKFLKFAYQKCCVDQLRFQNIYRLNRGPSLSLLDLEEKCTRNARVPTNEAVVRSPRSSSGAKQGSILPHIFTVLGVVCEAGTKVKIWVRMWLPYKFSRLTSSRSTNWRFENRK